jgi:hypothetical protein
MPIKVAYKSELPRAMNLSGLSLRDLEYVVAIADHGSFVRAAEHCRVAQPSLSAQVRKLGLPSSNEPPGASW